MAMCFLHVIYLFFWDNVECWKVQSHPATYTCGALRTGSQSRAPSPSRTQRWSRGGLWSTTCSFAAACLSSTVSRQLGAVGGKRTKRTLEAPCQSEDCRHEQFRRELRKAKIKLQERKRKKNYTAEPLYFLSINKPFSTAWTNYRQFSSIKTSGACSFSAVPSECDIAAT